MQLNHDETSEKIRLQLPNDNNLRSGVLVFSRRVPSRREKERTPDRGL